MIAGIKGKDVREARDHEDSLTSAVFGHLRYLPPGVFWPRLFDKVRDATKDKRTLASVLANSDNFSLTQCAKLKIAFWPADCGKDIGEPDIILTFCNRDDLPLLTIVVEVKFHAEQSGDQLARYMKLVKNPPASYKADYVCLIYLTPRESLHEINKTIRADKKLEKFRDRMFRLQWQDVLDAANMKGDRSFLHNTILADLVEFLRKRGLERFNGIQPVKKLELFNIKPAPWLLSDRSKDRQFNGMKESNALKTFAIKKGAWNQ